MIVRRQLDRVVARLGRFPVVALVGPRQVGKTTLARAVAAGRDALLLDLERPSDRAKLQDPELFLSRHAGRLVVIDEVQLGPELFPVLRPLVDEDRRPGRFLLLGSASPALVQRGAESLAGRIAWVELAPVDLAELPAELPWRDHWWRGGFPEPLLAPDDRAARDWHAAFLRTWVERDLAVAGLVPSPTLASRFLQMVAHRQGQLWNAQALATSLGVSAPTVTAYRDRLVEGFVLRVLRPLHTNLEKRLVKSPKVYVRDPGLLHTLAGVPDSDALFGHPLIGPSFEGYVVEQIAALAPEDCDCSFLRSHAGAELDLVITRGGHALAAFEIKHSSAPVASRGFFGARADLGDPPGFVVYPGKARWPVAPGVEVIGVEDVPAVVRGL